MILLVDEPGPKGVYKQSLKSSEMKRLRTALTTRVSLPPSYLDTAKASGVSGAVSLSLF